MTPLEMRAVFGSLHSNDKNLISLSFSSEVETSDTGSLEGVGGFVFWLPLIRLHVSFQTDLGHVTHGGAVELFILPKPVVVDVVEVGNLIVVLFLHFL